MCLTDREIEQIERRWYSWRNWPAFLIVAFFVAVLVAKVTGAELTDYASHVKDGDWSPALQAAMDDLVENDGSGYPYNDGGIINVNKGTYRFNQGMVVPCGGIAVVGKGGAVTLACLFDWRGGDLPMFVLPSPLDKRKRTGGFRISGVALRSRGCQGTAFRFETDIYDTVFEFDHVSAAQFGTVFDFRGPKIAGELRIKDSRLVFNDRVIVAPHGLNETSVERTRAHKNCQRGGTAITIGGGSNIHFVRTNLENQRYAFDGNHLENATFTSCRLENNHGDGKGPVMLIRNSNGVHFLHCWHRITAAENGITTLRLENCRDVTKPTNFQRVEEVKVIVTETERQSVWSKD